jgi:uncharacterized protein YidB (DUF937 family)
MWQLRAGEEGNMATFDKLIQEIGARYHLGSKGRSLVQETLDLIDREPGGISGLLDRFKAAGFAAEVASWIGGTDAVPLSGQEVEDALGSGVISEIADKTDLSQRFVRTILGYTIPKIIGQLAQGGVADLTIPLSSSHADEIRQPGAAQIPPSGMGGGGAAPARTLGIRDFIWKEGDSGRTVRARHGPKCAGGVQCALGT